MAAVRADHLLLLGDAGRGTELTDLRQEEEKVNDAGADVSEIFLQIHTQAGVCVVCVSRKTGRGSATYVVHSMETLP